MSNTIKTCILDKIPIRVMTVLDEDKFLYGQSFASHTEMAARQIALELRGWLMGEKLPEKTIRYPADWIQAFKARWWKWFPAWAQKRWPIKYTVHRIAFEVIYPDFRPKLFEDLGERHIVKVNIFNGTVVNPNYSATHIL